MPAWWLFWQKLVPGMFKVTREQKQDCKTTEGLKAMLELPHSFLCVDLCGWEVVVFPPTVTDPSLLFGLN